MRSAAILTALAVLGGCSAGGTHRGGHLSNVQYLSAIQSVPAPMRTGSSGAPIVGLAVSGTITNDGKVPMHCSSASFVLVRNSGGAAIAPASQFCGLPSIAPQQSTYFNATFVAAPNREWKLRFEHGDGSYEMHDLIVPPG